jgi:SHS2 domain-containing protein
VKRFELLAHTADVRLHVVGTSQAELFSAALEGMAAIIANAPCHPPFDVFWDLSLSSLDTTALLVDFLSAVLTQTQVTKAIFCCATFTVLTPTSITVRLEGKRALRFDEDIKAVTYHEANVVRDADGNWSTVLVFDI